MSNRGSYLTGYNDKKGDFAIVANYQLINRKTEQKKNKETGITIRSTIVRKKSWTVRVYFIPVELLKIGDLVVTQKARHFDISPRMKKFKL